MRLVSVKSIEGEMKLAQPIFNESGQVLLNTGVVLTKRFVSRLKELGITYVYIEDERTKDVTINNPVSLKTRREAIVAIESAFEIAPQQGELEKAFIMGDLTKVFTAVIENLLKDIRSHKEAISLLSEAYSYDNYIFTHSLNVTIYALALGLKLNLTSKQLEEMGMGALLHDIGKTKVPLRVLLKPGRLNDDEYSTIKLHAEQGFEILRRIHTIPLVAAHCAYQHHERLNGSGYPRGIGGDDIHLYSRIIGVADVYDAVTSNRVYRPAMLPHEGLEILFAGADSLFDLEMVEVFRKVVALYPNGMCVVLNNNKVGVVVRQNEGLNERPVVRVIRENGIELDIPYDIDLRKELSVVIVETDLTL